MPVVASDPSKLALEGFLEAGAVCEVRERVGHGASTEIRRMQVAVRAVAYGERQDGEDRDGPHGEGDDRIDVPYDRGRREDRRGDEHEARYRPEAGRLATQDVRCREDDQRREIHRDHAR